MTVLDPPGAIQHVHNRQSMLQEVADLDLSDCNGIFFSFNSRARSISNDNYLNFYFLTVLFVV